MIHRILAADAATCGLMGLVLTAAPAGLSELLGLPRDLLLYAGLSLYPIALFMTILARQAQPWAFGVSLVVAGNLAWVAASAAVFAFTSPNMLGAAFMVLQAAVVGLFASLEHAHRPRRAAATAAA